MDAGVQHQPASTGRSVIEEDPSAQAGADQIDDLQEAYCGGCHRLIDEDSVEDGIIQFA